MELQMQSMRLRQRLLALASGLLLAIITLAVPVSTAHGATARVGPDAFGYSATDAIPFSFVDISSTGTNVNAGDDSRHGPLDLGFMFNFYGVPYNQFWLSSNGWVSLGGADPGTSDFFNQCPLPSTRIPNNIIAGIWDDLNPLHPVSGGTRGAGAVYYQSFAAGSCPYDGYPGACSIALWDRVAYYLRGTTTFEIILLDNNESVVQVASADGGGSSTTGIENASGRVGLTYACNRAGSVVGPRAIRFAEVVAPDTSITAGPANPTSSSVAAFGFVGSDNVTAPANLTFECSLDGTTFVACAHPVTYPDLSAGSHTFRVRAVDQAGNVDPTPASYNWVVVADTDTAPPRLDCVVPDQSPWYGGDVTVHCTASDSGSGLHDPGDASFDLVASVPAGTAEPSASTASRTICDSRSNCTAVGPWAFRIDRKAPAVDCGAADTSWYKTDQSVECTARDDGAGPGEHVVTLNTSVTADTETGSASTNSIQVCDAVGNCAAVGPVEGFRIDKKPPDITIAAPSAATYAIGQAISATFKCIDNGSGVAACTGTASSGSSVDTGSGGNSTFTVTAVDNVGNQSTLSEEFAVGYLFSGFLPPINNAGRPDCPKCTVSTFKRGSTVPVKFQLKDASGNVVRAKSAPPWLAPQPVDPSNVVVGEGTVSSSRRTTDTFRWDETDRQYIFNWSTKGLATGYWQIGVALDDGQTQYVTVALR